MNVSDRQGDLLQTPSPVPAPSLQVELEEHIRGLHTVLIVTLIVLVLLSLSLILFMGKQLADVRAQLYATQLQAQKVYGDYKKNDEPLIRQFIVSLQFFAATNRDFGVVLEKYRPVLSPYYTPAVRATPLVPPVMPQPPKSPRK